MTNQASRVSGDVSVPRFYVKNEGGKFSMVQDQLGYWCKHDDVARLQAELATSEKWAREHCNRAEGFAGQIIESADAICRLEADLTKARELLSDVTESVTGRSGTFARVPADWFDRRDAHQSAPAAKSEPECTSCDGSGEYIDSLGDWRGYCKCPAGIAAKGEFDECEPAAKGDL